MTVAELLEAFRNGNARLTTRPTASYLIGPRNADYPAIFITIDDEGYPAGNDDQNYFVDEAGEEAGLTNSEEEEIAQAIATFNSRAQSSGTQTLSESSRRTGTAGDEERVLTLAPRQYDLVFGALRLYQNIATHAQRALVQDIVTNAGLWPEVLSPDDPILLDIFEREAFDA